jgi:hypothetical protein
VRAFGQEGTSIKQVPYWRWMAVTGGAPGWLGAGAMGARAAVHMGGLFVRGPCLPSWMDGAQNIKAALIASTCLGYADQGTPALCVPR